MNSMRRAYFHLIEKRKQTALLFSLFLLFMGLILSCLYYESIAEEEKGELAEKTGAALIVGRQADFHKLPTERDGMITEAQIDQLSEIEGIARVELAGRARVIGKDVRAYWGMFREEDAEEYGYMQEDIDEMKPEYLHIKGITCPENEIDFREGKEVLLEGRFPKRGETGYAIISKKVAKESEKSLGDTITIKGDNGNETALKIIGIQSQNTEDYFPMWTDPVNRIYTDIKTLERLTGEKAYNEVRFILKDARDMKKLKTKAEQVFHREQYSFLEDTIVYDRGVQSIESIGQTAKVAKWVILIAEMFVFLLLIFWQFGDRYREIGVLLSIGEKKSGILLQLFLEMFIPMMTAFLMVSVIGVVLINITVGMFVFVSNILVLLFAVVIPGMCILKKHPSELLVHG